MVPRPAQYLLRFDDLCPTISQRRWSHYLRLIEEFRLKPILAVIPDNRDYKLQVSKPDPEFWDGMRALEFRGSAIALHGYQHLCQSWDACLLPLHRRSEFAGVPEATQREWIHNGLEILRGHRLNPRLWVAPRHGFDWTTLAVLRQEGITILSDGLARVPVARGGMTWIPQQLWEPVEKSRGLWTICIHANTQGSETAEKLRTFLLRHADQFTSVDRVLAEYDVSQVSMAEHAYERMAMWRFQISRLRKNAWRGARAG
jgi:predicted deacetylase